MPPTGIPEFRVIDASLSHRFEKGARVTIGELYTVIDRKAVSSGQDVAGGAPGRGLPWTIYE